jgi:hypothetical protein
MITKQTAHDIWIAYDEIAKGKKLLADMEAQLAQDETINQRLAIRRRPLQLGIPSGESSHRLLDVAPALAIEVIKAHIAAKTAELGEIQHRARAELDEVSREEMQKLSNQAWNDAVAETAK